MSFVKRVIEFVMDILETIVFVGSIFIMLYLFIMQPNQVKGASMEPTFASGDYIFTSKITYKFRSPERGDIVVFRSPKNPDIDYIKRVIGLPGDQILIQKGTVFVNGTSINESYITSSTNLWDGGFVSEGVPITVPESELFVMGDNRQRSSDSREFGPIPAESVIGQVFYRYFPSSKMGEIRNPFPKTNTLRSSSGLLVSLPCL
ncbi:signal peptidase I [Candidatus Roizmanbacteria bacterium CG09_land_8_20_14_0_10_41_9]|uniref:Signal peptidase I n=1 Tax=Candidatus Roizmanbacteria bacterium CG09_land_8_20_14_0_10_41_9 TaxID=1974850 RepID=A0A2H0WT66_9BACT|nr:MAG: signal peptidase I [Candidatus Roizmanbacteria bacterium CG09_land_8_20_14_0_10_41_9]